MSNYVKNFTETFNFDGDTVTIELTQLKRVDALKLLPYVSVMDKASKGDVSPEVIEQSNKFVEVASEILKETDYVKSIKGLSINGNKVKPDSAEYKEIVLEDFYFTGVVAAIAGLLIKNSSMTRQEEKKLEGQSKDTTSVES